MCYYTFLNVTVELDYFLYQVLTFKCHLNPLIFNKNNNNLKLVQLIV